MSTRPIDRITPRASGLLGALTASTFCAVRLAHLGGGAGTFVVAARPFVDPSTVPGRIPVAAAGGFDGQFFYRLALDPFTVGMGRAHGIAFDYGVRGGRVGYPALVWLASFGGHPALVASALIVVNIVAAGVLAFVAAHLAEDHGRKAAWGLTIAGYWGFAIVLGRDLSELVAAAAVFTVLLLVGRRRFWWAGAVATVAVSTREQAVLTIAAISIGIVLCEARRGSLRRAVGMAARVAVPPAVVFIAWQAAVARVTGELPATSSSRYNSTVPFSAFPAAIRTWVRDLGDGLSPSGGMSLGLLLPLACFAGLIVVVVLAVTSDGLRMAWVQRPWEVLAGAAAVLVLVSSAPDVLRVPADFRQSYEVVGCAWLVLWAAAPTRRRVALALVLPLTLVVAGFRCLVL